MTTTGLTNGGHDSGDENPVGLVEQVSQLFNDSTINGQHVLSG